MNPRTWLTSEPVAEAVGEAIAICRDQHPRDCRDADSGEVAQAAIGALLEMLDDDEGTDHE